MTGSAHPAGEAPKPCSERHPLLRDGTSQASRRLTALHPKSARIDDRTLADFVTFARRYAKDVQYFDLNDRPDGDFAAFFETDGVVVIADLAAQNLQALLDCYDEAGAWLREVDEWNDEASRYLALQFALVLNRVGWLAELRRIAPAGLLLHQALERHIGASVRSVLRLSANYYRLASAHFQLFADDPELTLPLFAEHGLEPPGWRNSHIDAGFQVPDPGLPSTTFEGSVHTYVSRVAPDLVLARELDPFDAEPDQTKARKLVLLLDRQLQVLHKVLAQLKAEARGFLWESLQSAEHKPQMALFLTFLRLFQVCQRELNRSTERHLDYYYERVLRLEKRAARPDSVALVFEPTADVLLDEGTLFSAGVNASGQAMEYRLKRSVELNAAKLLGPEDTKAIFFDAADGFRPYAAPAAASKDGNGAAFDVPEPKWKPFGESQRTSNGFRPIETRNMNFAELGFAIASPELFMASGRRSIELKLELTTAPELAGLTRDSISARVTVAEGWSELDWQSAPTLVDGSLTLELLVPMEAPAVAPYSEALHGGAYATNWPVLELRLKNGPDVLVPAYGLLKGLRVRALDLRTRVDGTEALLLQNDFGKITPGKPFYPFGVAPKEGSVLYVGCGEAFRKELESLTLRWSWHAPPSSNLLDHYVGYGQGDAPAEPLRSFDNAEFRASVAWLEGTWQSLSDDQQLFLDNTTSEVTFSESLSIRRNAGARQLRAQQALTDLTPGDTWGYLSLRLSGRPDPFGHQEYPKLYTRAAIALAKDDQTAQLPNAPWNPLLASIRLDYVAHTRLDLRDADGEHLERFYHWTPFGSSEPTPGSAGVALCPEFSTPTPTGDVPSEGELYLGFSNFRPPRSLSLWIQVAEGSADPKVVAPGVSCSVLTERGWRAFSTSEIVEDGTQGLTRSGLVVLNVPGSATSRSSLLPRDRHWLRLSVAEHARGVCDIIAVHPQAAEAELTQPERHAEVLRTALPADSIKKLKQKRSEIKKVMQPFASFGGQPEEAPRNYRLRVSERLRHKGRGVSVWDYERLVLERFPEIWKAKCINHSTYLYEDADVAIPQSEFAPGYVTLVVVPDLRNKNAVDPLTPRASLATLNAVHAYLCERISAFAAERLRVMNPAYHPLQARFRVAFRAGFGFGVTSSRLKQDLTAHLTPWTADDASTRDIVFGGRIHRSHLIHFVEKLAYVDYVTDFELLSDDGGGLHSVEVATPPTAHSILTSAATHEIGEIEELS